VTTPDVRVARDDGVVAVDGIAVADGQAQA
jgi:hypothetical protein